MLLDQAEPPRGLAAGDRGQRLDVLLLAPGRPRDQPARSVDGRPRRRGVTLEERKERRARVGEGETLVDRHGGGERPIRAEAVREQSVHAVLVVLGGTGRRRRHRQSVAIGDAHGLGSASG